MDSNQYRGIDHTVVCEGGGNAGCCSVTEGDLLDVLKLHGAQKQLRQVLNSLKKDKLIRRWECLVNCLVETIFSSPSPSLPFQVFVP